MCYLFILIVTLFAHCLFAELLLSFTAGGFLYLAAVNMLPSIVRTKSSALQSVLELLCFVAGVGMMVLVTFLE